MANSKISQLPTVGSALSTDLLPIDRSGVNYALTAAQIAALANTTAGPQGTAAPAILYNFEGVDELVFSGLGSGNFNTPTPNQVQIFALKLQNAFSFNKLSLTTSSVIGGGAHVGIGLYDSSGNRLVHWDNILLNANAAQFANNLPTGGASLQLPGYYYWASAADTSSVVSTAGSLVTSGSGEGNKPWNISVVRTGVAANLMVAGVLPATLGALTGGYPVGGNGQPCWIIEP